MLNRREYYSVSTTVVSYHLVQVFVLTLDATTDGSSRVEAPC